MNIRIVGMKPAGGTDIASDFDETRRGSVSLAFFHASHNHDSSVDVGKGITSGGVPRMTFKLAHVDCKPMEEA